MEIPSTIDMHGEGQSLGQDLPDKQPEALQKGSFYEGLMRGCVGTGFRGIIGRRALIGRQFNNERWDEQ